MGLLDWLFSWTKSSEENKWYSFYDTRKTNNDWTNAEERFKHYDALKVVPFAYIKGKKYRAKFILKNGYWKIIAGKHRIVVPENRCSFREKETALCKAMTDYGEFLREHKLSNHFYMLSHKFSKGISETSEESRAILDERSSKSKN